MVTWFVIIKRGEIVMMNKVFIITNPSVDVPNRLSNQVLTGVLNTLKLLD